jgi:hypothetical protein
MTTYAGHLAFLMYIIEFETICDHGDLTEYKSDENCAHMDLLLKKINLYEHFFIETFIKAE